jgi:hypothetical protein
VLDLRERILAPSPRRISGHSPIVRSRHAFHARKATFEGGNPYRVM